MSSVTNNPRGAWKRMPVGSVAVRRGKITNYKPRQWIKVRADGPPKDRWRILSTVIWELANGAVPKGFKVCHRDGDLMSDGLDNLVCLSNADAILHFQRTNPRMKARSRAGVIRGTAKRWEDYHMVKDAATHRDTAIVTAEVVAAPSDTKSKARARIAEFVLKLKEVA